MNGKNLSVQHWGYMEKSFINDLYNNYCRAPISMLVLTSYQLIHDVLNKHRTFFEHTISMNIVESHRQYTLYTT